MQVEVEVAVGAAEAADIDDTAEHPGRREIPVGDGTGDLIDDQIHAPAAGNGQHLVDPAGVAGVDREVGAELLQPPAARGIGRRSDHRPGAFQPGDLQRHQADPRACALDQHRLTALQPAVGDERVVHRRQRDRQRGGDLEAHALRNRKQPLVIGEGVFGKRRAARSHHAIADLDAAGLRSQFDDLSRPLHAEHGAGATRAAVGMTLGHAQVGPVEAAGANPHQHLGALRRGFGNLGDGSAAGAIDERFHGIGLAGWTAPYSAAARRLVTTIDSRRPSMMASASRTMRDTSSSQLGISSIRPCTWPADQMP